MKAKFIMASRLLIESRGKVLLEFGRDENVLLPLEESERVTVFKALSDALALLAGLMPPNLPNATAIGLDESAGETEQHQPDHRSDVVVHLKARRHIPNAE